MLPLPMSLFICTSALPAPHDVPKCVRAVRGRPRVGAGGRLRPPRAPTVHAHAVSALAVVRRGGYPLSSIPQCPQLQNVTKFNEINNTNLGKRVF